MQTQNPHPRTILLACTFTLLCLVLTLLAYRSFGGATPLSPHSYRFSIPVTDAGNLGQGSDVQQAGVKIGRVVDVRRDHHHGLVTVDLIAKYGPVSSATTAMVRTKSLLGESYVDINRGATSGAPLPENGTLRATQVTPGVSFNEFLDGFAPAARANMRRLFAGLATAFDGRSAELNRSLGCAPPFTGGLQTVLRKLGSQTDDLQVLTGDSAVVLDALGRRQRALRDAITAGDEVFATTAQRRRALAATLRRLPPFLTQLHRTSDTINATAQPLNRAAASLSVVSTRLPGAITALAQNLPKFDALFRDLPRTVAAAKQGLPALTSIAAAIPEGFDHLYPALRDLIPLVQLLNTYRRSAIVSPLSNGAATFNGTTVGPLGKIVHRTSGMLYLSNETVVGWTKRLPTNRANPYPKPDAFKLLSTRGFLDSYDCRNVNNPVGLPAIGTGVPPCVTQGPWTYRGKTAYYPRLSRAPK